MQKATAAALETRLEAVFEAHFGFVSEFLVRDAAELDAIIAANPFGDAALERPSRMVVTFFSDSPAARIRRSARDRP